VNVIANWIRKALRDFLQQTLTTAFFLRLIGVFFDLLHKGVGVIPGSFDDKALADFEATVDKPALAASMQKAVLDFLMPGLQSVYGGPAATGPVELADLDAALPAVVAEVNAAIAA
jgi:hypothetical protein